MKKQEIKKMVDSTNDSYYSVNGFISDARRYIKAIKEGRIIVDIASVSKSGMSRKMKFLECTKHKNENRYSYLNFYALFNSFGYSFGDRDTFQVNGCGMDMVFNTNYNNMHTLKSLGFITNEQCSTLAQQTPAVI